MIAGRSYEREGAQESGKGVKGDEGERRGKILAFPLEQTRGCRV